MEGEPLVSRDPQHAQPARASTVSAPGSLMLFGEHAVLRGHPAVCASVNRRVRVTAVARNDRRLLVRSALGEHAATLDRIIPTAPFEFVLATVASVAGELPAGIALDIQSEFSSVLGLGSSAAVTAASMAALWRLMGRDCAPAELHKACLAVVRSVQAVASGADLAASIAGGVVAYRDAPPPEWRRLTGLPTLTVVYSGVKMRTADVIAAVARRREQLPDAMESVDAAIGRIAAAAADAIDAADWFRVGALMDEGQGLMDALGVNTPALAEIVNRLRAAETIHGAKISGSGMGDCAVGLGTFAGDMEPYRVLNVELSGEGLVCE